MHSMSMLSPLSPLQQFSELLARGKITPRDVAEQALARANSNAGHNVYLALDAEKVREQADALPQRFPRDPKPPLYGVPVSIKDCFDVTGSPTTLGSRYYAERNGVAREDSAVAARLRSQGAIIIGKTHMHTLAYGITGENPEYGDCMQPRDAGRLTGGSSSGAAASVQEQSALAAIGTDTGGSVRVPAALCGIAGYRASVGLAEKSGLWRGGVHLAPTFDTLGWLFQDLRDAPLLAEALFGLRAPDMTETRFRIGCVRDEFLHDCDEQALAWICGVEEKTQRLRRDDLSGGYRILGRGAGNIHRDHRARSCGDSRREYRGRFFALPCADCRTAGVGCVPAGG